MRIMRRPDGGCSTVHQFFNASAVCSSLADCDSSPSCRLCLGGSGWQWLGAAGACVCNGMCDTEQAELLRQSHDSVVSKHEDIVLKFFIFHILSFAVLRVLSCAPFLKKWTRVWNSVCIVVPSCAMFYWMYMQVHFFGPTPGAFLFFVAASAFHVFFVSATSLEAEVSRMNSCDMPAEVCAVCLEMPGDWVALAECDHRFHRACIEEWMHSGKGCPVCRAGKHDD